MYPAYVVPLLLEGQKQMVCDVQGAAVFFSDIHEFTSASADGPIFLLFCWEDIAIKLQ